MQRVASAIRWFFETKPDPLFDVVLFVVVIGTALIVGAVGA